VDLALETCFRVRARISRVRILVQTFANQ
jgi:hypothetical protein